MASVREPFFFNSIHFSNIFSRNFLTFWAKRVMSSNVRGDDVACRSRMPMVGFGPFDEWNAFWVSRFTICLMKGDYYV